MNPRLSCHFVDTTLIPYLKKAAEYIFLSAKDKVTARFGSFHVFGLDFMMDESLGIHF